MSEASESNRTPVEPVNAVEDRRELVRSGEGNMSSKKGKAEPKTATGSPDASSKAVGGTVKSPQKAGPAEGEKFSPRLHVQLETMLKMDEVIQKLKRRDSTNGIIPIQELADAGSAILDGDAKKLMEVVVAGAQNAGSNDNYTRMGTPDKYLAYSVLSKEEIAWCFARVGEPRSRARPNPAHAAIVAKIEAMMPMVELLKDNPAAVKTVQAEIAKLDGLLATIPKSIPVENKGAMPERSAVLADGTNAVERLARAKTYLAWWKANANLPHAKTMIAFWEDAYNSEVYAKLKKSRCITKEGSDKLRPAIVAANERLIKQL